MIDTIKDQFVKDYFLKNNLDLLIKDEEKHWGGYYVFEENDDFDRKVLWVKPGMALSLQFHGTPEAPGHREEWIGLTRFGLFLSDDVGVGLDKDKLLEIADLSKALHIQEGEQVQIEAGQLHALANPYNHDIYVLEQRFSQVKEKAKDREENIVRIYDQAARPGTKPFPRTLWESLFGSSNIEIERKWLLDKLPEEVKNQEPIPYERHFIFSSDEIELRVQKKGAKYFLERKVAKNELSREEEVLEITEGEFQALKKSSYASLERESYKMDSLYGDLSIKKYKGQYDGLIRAEIEFETEEDAKNFQAPDWFGKEITNTSLGKDKKLIELSSEEFNHELDKLTTE